ncbi:MAG: hypothetical protein O2968_09055 [Acidobacteria bacterium]|nr:hypothetical protein [Acidobacteriota bacterium]
MRQAGIWSLLPDGALWNALKVVRVRIGWKSDHLLAYAVPPVLEACVLLYVGFRNTVGRMALFTLAVAGYLAPLRGGEA